MLVTTFEIIHFNGDVTCVTNMCDKLVWRTGGTHGIKLYLYRLLWNNCNLSSYIFIAILNQITIILLHFVHFLHPIAQSRTIRLHLCYIQWMLDGFWKGNIRHKSWVHTNQVKKLSILFYTEAILRWNEWNLKTWKSQIKDKTTLYLTLVW